MRSKIYLYKDDNTEVIFRPKTMKVIIGINKLSHFKSKYVSFNVKDENEAKFKAEDYLKIKL